MHCVGTGGGAVLVSIGLVLAGATGVVPVALVAIEQKERDEK